MEQSPNPLTKALIPTDGSQASMKAVDFAGCLAKALGPTLESILLVHVLGGAHLRKHMEKRDIRAAQVVESETILTLRERHIEEEVRPFLDEAARRLRELGAEQPVEELVVDGSPAGRIMELAHEKRTSTIFIGRRGLSALKEFILGSVTLGLVNQPGRPTIYIVSEEPLTEGVCPVPRILAALDGSAHTESILSELEALANVYRDEIQELVLVRVVDLARYEERKEQGINPESEAREIVDTAKGRLLKAGLPEERLETLILYGRPAERILELARERASNLVVIGKRGRSVLKDLIVGSVALEVIHRLTSAVIAVTSA